MMGSQTKRLKPGTRSKKFNLYYTEDTDEELKQRALEICERYDVDVELVKIHKEHRVEDWKKINTEITRILKEDSK